MYPVQHETDTGILAGLKQALEKRPGGAETIVSVTVGCCSYAVIAGRADHIHGIS